MSAHSDPKSTPLFAAICKDRLGRIVSVHDQVFGFWLMCNEKLVGALYDADLKKGWTLNTIHLISASQLLFERNGKPGSITYRVTYANVELTSEYASISIQDAEINFRTRRDCSDAFVKLEDRLLVEFLPVFPRKVSE